MNNKIFSLVANLIHLLRGLNKYDWLSSEVEYWIVWLVTLVWKLEHMSMEKEELIISIM